ncbi:MAG: NAD(P)-binding domain-containing protein [Ktedonobacteraceae bacterium]|nr:NAD(P)-binding domain-containing protein [Ktedonobacteraceae bacterium]
MSAIKIVVLGAGNIGGTLGRKWVTAGEQVIFGVNNPNGENARKLRSNLGDHATIQTTAEALATNPDVVVLAIPGPAMDATIAQYAKQLDGKIIIDTANKMGANTHNSFAALQQHAPHASIYRAFNTLGWENFADALFDDTPADLFYCGTDGDARATVEQLISDVGLRPVSLGNTEQVGVVDSLLGLWFALAVGQKKGRHLAFKMLAR